MPSAQTWPCWLFYPPGPFTPKQGRVLEFSLPWAPAPAPPSPLPVARGSGLSRPCCSSPPCYLVKTDTLKALWSHGLHTHSKDLHILVLQPRGWLLSIILGFAICDEDADLPGGEGGEYLSLAGTARASQRGPSLPSRDA